MNKTCETHPPVLHTDSISQKSRAHRRLLINQYKPNLKKPID